MPQSVQIVQIAQTRRATYPAVVSVDTGKFVRLGDEMMRTVTNAANNNVGIGRSDTAYRGEIAWGATRADLFKVDLNTGARTPIEKGLSRTYGTSPDSKWFLYLKNKQVHRVQSRERQGRDARRIDDSREELRERGRRSRVREADLGRRRMDARRKVGAAL